jgi:hypothetical protein
MNKQCDQRVRAAAATRNKTKQARNDDEEEEEEEEKEEEEEEEEEEKEKEEEEEEEEEYLLPLELKPFIKVSSVCKVIWVFVHVSLVAFKHKCLSHRQGKVHEYHTRRTSHVGPAAVQWSSC